MKTGCLALLCLLLPLSAQNLAQLVSASGSVYWFNPAGKNSKPCKQWPVRLARVEASGKPDTLQSKTDSYGQYAFYGLPDGEYELEIPRGFGRVFRKKIKVPGNVDPIVLPPRLPALADSSALIRVESDYEVLGPNRYRFKLRTDIPPEWKPLVQKVRYLMDHPTFAQKALVGTDPKTDFEADYVGWGCLEKVSVVVAFAHDTWTVDFPFCADLKAKAQAKNKTQPPVK